MVKSSWRCLIGEYDWEKLPPGSDLPMRNAIRQAYFDLTGEYPAFLFSRWGAQPDDIQPDDIQREMISRKTT